MKFFLTLAASFVAVNAACDVVALTTSMTGCATAMATCLGGDLTKTCPCLSSQLACYKAMPSYAGCSADPSGAALKAVIDGYPALLQLSKCAAGPAPSSASAPSASVAPNCPKCAADFKAAGGCTATGMDTTKIPAGCNDCSDAATKICQTVADCDGFSFAFDASSCIGLTCVATAGADKDKVCACYTTAQTCVEKLPAYAACKSEAVASTYVKAKTAAGCSTSSAKGVQMGLVGFAAAVSAFLFAF